MLSFLFIASCGDQGCIEADDFGEYQTQILTIYANPSSQSCDYDSTKALTDTEQPESLKSCFTSGTITVSDGNEEITSSSGCLGFGTMDKPVHQNLCIQECIQTCIETNLASSSTRPNWKPTSPKLKNSGNNTVSIIPGSEIYISALGTINLIDKITLPDVYLRANYNGLQYSKLSTWEQSNYYVKSGQTRDLRFSGLWNNGSINIGGGNSASISATTLNGGKRLVAYIVPHLSSYGDNVPAQADTSLWRCGYDSTANATKQLNCYSLDYPSDILNTIALQQYDITANKKADNLGAVGGSIRWTSDGLESESFEPISDYPCDTYPCKIDLLKNSQIATSTSDDVKIYKIGEEVAVGNVEKTSQVAGFVYFKSLLSSNICNVNIVVKIFDDEDNQLYSYNVPITNTSWSSAQIVLEPTQKLRIQSFATKYTLSGNTSEISCGEAIGLKFLKSQDITITKSGYLSFSRLTTESGSSGSCTIYGRVINPDGSHTDKTVDGFAVSADYYEYDNFDSSNSSDPLNNLSVPIGNFSNQIYVRKGQVIRFSPKSWNGTWVVGPSKIRQCGIGTVMKIEQRPAFLCRGQSSEYVNNPDPDCVQDFSQNGDTITTTLIGCKSYDSECNDSSSGSYCLDSVNSSGSTVYCSGTISCSSNGIDPAYQKTGCTATDYYDNNFCNFNNAINAAKCSSCRSKRLANAQKPAKITMNLDQCYNLEDYKGKVSNIPSGSGFSSDQLSNSEIGKGATLLGAFNGSYGNFSNLYMTEDVDSENNNKIFQSRDVLTFNIDGILKFMVLDGNDFVGNHYSNNSSSGGSYSGTNGYKISLSSSGQYKNGEWLEVKLCKEDIDTDGVFGTNCSLATIPDTSLVSEAPKVIEFETSSTSLFTPKTTTDFNYNSYGNLVKVSNSDGKKIANHSVGSQYYMHKYQYNTQEEIDLMSDADKEIRDTEISKLRLSFRIKDPETGNCKIKSSDEKNNGIKTENPAYDPNISGAIGAICEESEVPVSNFNSSTYPGKTQCVKQYFCADIYSNNSGYYDVTVRVKDTNNISNFIGTVVEPVIEVMDGKRSQKVLQEPDCKTNSNFRSNNGVLNSQNVCEEIIIPGANCVTDLSLDYFNGVKVINDNYDSNYKDDGKGETCLYSAMTLGTCHKEFYCDTNVALSGHLGTCNTGVIPITGIKRTNPFYNTCFKGESNCNKQYKCLLKAQFNTKIDIIPDCKTNPFLSYKDGVLTQSGDKKVCIKSGEKGQAEIIYDKIINDVRYKAILNMSLVIMITFYGVSYLMGITEHNSSGIFGRAIKIGLIYLFVSPTGWEFFNGFVVQTFKNGTDHLAFLMASSFDDSSDLAEAIQNQDYYDKSILFSSVDKVWGLFFNDAVQKKIAGLLFASVFGWIYVLIIYYSFFTYVGAVANAVLLYLTAQVFISILFILAPIFFVFTLFNQTKSMFDNWLKNLIGFSLQQVFLLTTLAFFNMMMYEVIKMALAFKVCWDEVWVINILTRIKLMDFWTLASMPPVADNATDVANIGVNNGIPSLFTILFIWIIANLMDEFIDFMTNLAQSIGGGIKATELASDVKKTAKDMTDSFTKNTWKKTGEQIEKRVDKALFDSGSEAKKQRNSLKEASQKDIANKKALRDAGEQSIKDYKKHNAAALASMSKEDQREALEKARDKGIADKGAKMGLNAAQIDRLKSDSGVKYVGENLFGFALTAAKQRGLSRRSGGGLGAINNQKVDTRFSSKMKGSPFRSDIKSALKHAKTDEDRRKISEAIDSGAIGTKSSFRRQDKELRTHLIPEELRSGSYYNRAEQALEKDGVITKMMVGTKWARNDSEKARIREEAKKLRDKDAQDRSDAIKSGAERPDTLAKDFTRAQRFESQYSDSGIATPNSNDAKKHLAQQKERERQEEENKEHIDSLMGMDDVFDADSAAKAKIEKAKEEQERIVKEAFEGNKEGSKTPDTNL